MPLLCDPATWQPHGSLMIHAGANGGLCELQASRSLAGSLRIATESLEENYKDGEMGVTAVQLGTVGAETTLGKMGEGRGSAALSPHGSAMLAGCAGYWSNRVVGDGKC